MACGCRRRRFVVYFRGSPRDDLVFVQNLKVQCCPKGNCTRPQCGLGVMRRPSQCPLFGWVASCRLFRRDADVYRRRPPERIALFVECFSSFSCRSLYLTHTPRHRRGCGRRRILRRHRRQFYFLFVFDRCFVYIRLIRMDALQCQTN